MLLIFRWHNNMPLAFFCLDAFSRSGPVDVLGVFPFYLCEDQYPKNRPRRAFQHPNTCRMCSLMKNKEVGRYVRRLPHVKMLLVPIIFPSGWNMIGKVHNFDLANLILPLVFMQRSWSCSVSRIHFYWLSVAFVLGRHDWTADAIEHSLWPLLERKAIFYCD